LARKEDMQVEINAGLGTGSGMGIGQRWHDDLKDNAAFIII